LDSGVRGMGCFAPVGSGGAVGGAGAAGAAGATGAAAAAAAAFMGLPNPGGLGGVEDTPTMRTCCLSSPYSFQSSISTRS
jgi:hypothetical protein